MKPSIFFARLFVVCLFMIGLLFMPAYSEAQEYAVECTLVVDGPGNDNNDDENDAEGPPDCNPPNCPANACRTQLGDFGVLVCENLDVPGGWIVPIAGDDNDFTVFEEWVDEGYDVYVEDPATETWEYAGTAPLGDHLSLDLPAGIAYTNRVRIEDLGISNEESPYVGADINAIASGIPTPPIGKCAGDGPCGTLRLAGSTSTANIMSYFVLLLLPFVSLLLWKRRKTK